MQTVDWLPPRIYRIPKYKPVMRGYRYSMDNKPSDTLEKAFYAHAFRRNVEFDTNWKARLNQLEHGL
jgi:hypothetical protein